MRTAVFLSFPSMNSRELASAALLTVRVDLRS